MARHYQQDISKSPREALAIRQFRYDSFMQYRVMGILNALPVLLGLGLILFFVGLIDFLQGLDVKVSIPVTTLIGIVFGFLVVTTSAPAFQYLAAIQGQSQPLFAFKSPQSLAILHLVTWLFPLRGNLKTPSWVALEPKLFPYRSVLRAYTGHALSWLAETYSHSSDMIHQIYLCLLDVDSSGDKLVVEDIVRTFQDNIVHPSSWYFSRSPGTEIKSLFNETLLPRITQAERDVRRSHCLGVLDTPFEFLPYDALIYAILFQTEEISWQRGILFRNLLLAERGSPGGIFTEVWEVFENLRIFTDEDLSSIFDAMRAWMGRHPWNADRPSYCWAALTSQLKPYELNEALRHRPPVRDFMAFLDSRFRIGVSVKYLCGLLQFHSGNWEGVLDLFFKALYAWIEQNPQDAQSLVHSQTMLMTLDPGGLEFMRGFRVFRDFEAFLEAQIARSKNIVE
ncbi:hypothetical protein BD779DRAFT_1676725 [Infundibulicybe gibba]|nr:hypothetical protein BD779DRAFT_1676725 [Infundibulicybe gibba]